MGFVMVPEQMVAGISSDDFSNSQSAPARDEAGAAFKTRMFAASMDDRDSQSKRQTES
jgi:hypothetical protein